MTKVNDLDKPLHSDCRGEIRRYNIDGTKFNILTTKAGALRSGDYHPNTQYNIILKGRLEITLRQDGRDVVMEKDPNELIEIPPNTPHLFKSLTESVIIEWWSGPFEVQYYEPYRKLVEDYLKKNEGQ